MNMVPPLIDLSTPMAKRGARGGSAMGRSTALVKSSEIRAEINWGGVQCVNNDNPFCLPIKVEVFPI